MILSFHLGPYAIKLLYCSLFYDQNVLNVCLVSCPVYCLVSSFRNREEPWQERGDFIVNKMTGLTLLVVWVDWSLVRTVWSGHKVSRQPGWAKSFYSVQLVSIHLELLVSWNARYLHIQCKPYFIQSCVGFFLYFELSSVLASNSYFASKHGSYQIS